MSPPQLGEACETQIGDVLAIDLRSPEIWLGSLRDRGIITPDPRDIKDPALLAERERRKQEVAKAAEADRPAKLNEIEVWWKTEQEKRWQNAVESYLRRLCLFVDNEAFPDIKPDWVYVWPDEYSQSDPGQFMRTYTLQFRLRRTPENREKWMNLLRGWGITDRPAVVTVGFVEQFDKRVDTMPSEVAPQASKPWQRFFLETAPDKQVLGAIFVSLFLAMAGSWLAISSDLLRDTNAPRNPSGRYPFSLGLCQLAYWLFLIGEAFLFIWVVTGDRTMTTSELTLLGISATTGLGAALINRVLPPCKPPVLTAVESQEKDPVKLFAWLQQARLGRAAAEGNLATARAAAVAAGAVAASVAPQEQALELAERRVSELEGRYWYFRSAMGKVQQFFLDLLRERDTVSLHRFQMLAWTVCLGLVFVFTVIMQLEMPKFDATLLTLIGISNGTYLGFKWPAAQS